MVFFMVCGLLKKKYLFVNIFWKNFVVFKLLLMDIYFIGGGVGKNGLLVVRNWRICVLEVLYLMCLVFLLRCKLNFFIK